jgi:hypothetical protein
MALSVVGVVQLGDLAASLQARKAAGKKQRHIVLERSVSRPAPSPRSAPMTLQDFSAGFWS